MSHISTIELEIRSLEELRKACETLGLEFCEDQKSYKWFGTWVGDAPLPEGISTDDLGKCDHAIRVPGAVYEIGIVKINSRYQLLFDYWDAGGLQKILGNNLGRLKQAYTAERVRRESRLKGYRIQEKKTNQGLRLILSV